MSLTIKKGCDKVSIKKKPYKSDMSAVSSHESPSVQVVQSSHLPHRTRVDGPTTRSPFHVWTSDGTMVTLSAEHKQLGKKILEDYLGKFSYFNCALAPPLMLGIQDDSFELCFSTHNQSVIESEVLECLAIAGYVHPHFQTICCDERNSVLLGSQHKVTYRALVDGSEQPWLMTNPNAVLVGMFLTGTTILFEGLINVYAFIERRKMKTCDYCGKHKITMKKCSKCQVFYCDKICQRQAWGKHKTICAQSS